MCKNDQENIVYIVHAIDTEGPLHEPLVDAFKRLKSIFGIELDPTEDNLRKIQRKEIDLNGQEDFVAETFSEHNLDYNDKWEKLDGMLEHIMSDAFRKRLPDSFGNGWIFNWHCVDHVGYEFNPRRRDLGMHKIFDHYRDMIQKTNSFQDGLHWHFHPMSVYKEAHCCATSFMNSPQLHEILCRRIIERNWFPKAYRAGFHAERPDSHWFLEQWIPFDISNIGTDGGDNIDKQLDQKEGRFGDWRLAPKDWSVYHPHHDNYQLSGNCRRWIGRALTLMMRVAAINQSEVDKAFERAQKSKATLLGITNHDFRDMSIEIEYFQNLLRKAKEKYPDVKFKYAEEVEAFRKVCYGDRKNYDPLELKCELESNGNQLYLKISVVKGEVFGPQPYLAVQTKSNRFLHDNLDRGDQDGIWTYTFDDGSIRAEDVAAIGIACNDKFANTFIDVIKP